MSKRKIPHFYINAFYESKFKDNLFVIKAGGKIIEDDAALDNLIANIRDLTLHGIKILLIYGGGKAMDDRAEKDGIGVKKIDGRRVTDQASLDIMKEVVGGTLSLRVSQAMARHRLEGLSFNAVPHDWMRTELRDKKPVDFGFVGNILSVQTRPVQRLFRTVSFISCACLALTPEGDLCNINADTIATRLASALKASKLMFLSDVDGVEVNGKPALLLTAEEIPGLIESGAVTGGMRVKLENCKAALEAGVRRIHLINGLRPDALKREIYESAGPGTMLIPALERENYMNEIEAQKLLESQSVSQSSSRA